MGSGDKKSKIPYQPTMAYRLDITISYIALQAQQTAKCTAQYDKLLQLIQDARKNTGYFCCSNKSVLHFLGL